MIWKIALGITFVTMLMLEIPAFSDVGKETSDLKLSRSFTLSWPRKLNLQMAFLPSLDGFWFEGYFEGKSYSVWTSHKLPSVFANKFSVHRFWSSNVENTKLLGDKSVDHGCSEFQSSYVYRCERSAVTSGHKYIAEELFWNAHDDIVVVRVSSGMSKSHAKQILGMFSTTVVNRLPATVTK